MRRLSLFALSACLSACVLLPEDMFSESFEKEYKTARSYTIFPPPDRTVFIGTQDVVQHNYVLNEVTSAKVGETMLRVKAFRRSDFVSSDLMLAKPVKIKIKEQIINLPAKKYPIYGSFEYENRSFFVLPKINHYHFLVDMDGVIQPMFLYEIKNSDKVSLFSDRLRVIPESAKMERVSYFEQPTVPYQDIEVVYEGVKNNKISLFYKSAVPGTDGGSGSFDTLFYPADSTMISVAGRLLRVIRADSEQITYIVVKE